MNDRKDTDEKVDRVLAGRFARMRQEDRADLPDFPGEDTLRALGSVPASSRRERHWWKVAAVAAAITAAAVLFAPVSPHDPGELYADIMLANTIATDQLMLPSPGTLPEVSGLPGLYDIDTSLHQAEIAN